jgi:hypothetical protein
MNLSIATTVFRGAMRGDIPTVAEMRIMIRLDAHKLALYAADSSPTVARMSHTHRSLPTSTGDPKVYKVEPRQRINSIPDARHV